MSYILKGCGPAGGLQSFVQQCIFNGASHEQEPYGPREDRKAEEEGQSGERGWGVRGVMEWWGERGVKREEKGGRRGCRWDRLWMIGFYALCRAAVVFPARPLGTGWRDDVSGSNCTPIGCAPLQHARILKKRLFKVRVNTFLLCQRIEDIPNKRCWL